jgi:hypothetical protein
MYIRNATVLTMADVIDTDVGAAGFLDIYDDTAAKPADADASVGSNVLLAHIPLNTPAFSAATDAGPGAVLNLDISPVPEDSVADATGTANFARITNSGGTCIVQLHTVGTSGQELNLNSVSISAGVAVQINSASSITIPES